MHRKPALLSMVWGSLLGATLTGCSPDATPVGETVDRIARADSVFAMASMTTAYPRGLQTDHFVVRYEPGTLALDRVDGRQRLLIKDGEVWTGDARRLARAEELEGSGLGVLANLERVLSVARVEDISEDARTTQHLDESYHAGMIRGPLGIDGAGRVLLVTKDGDPQRIRVLTPKGRIASVGGSSPSLLDFAVSYWQEDVDLEPGWDEAVPAGIPPIPRAVGGPLSREAPYAVHEVFREARLLPETEDPAPWGLHRSHAREAELAETCTEGGTTSDDVRVTFAPQTDGKPWQDAVQARREGCAVALVGTLHHDLKSTRHRSLRSCVQGEVIARAGDGTVLGKAFDDTCAVGNAAEETDWTIAVPGGVDLGALRLEWSDHHQIDCTGGPVRPGAQRSVHLASGLEARLQWDCGDEDGVTLDASARLRDAISGKPVH